MPGGELVALRGELELAREGGHTLARVVHAGGSATGMKGGRHIKFAKPAPLANLHLTLLERVGVRMDAFADGVFAIAFTLPIFHIILPAVGRSGTLLAHDLLVIWPQYLGYLLASAQMRRLVH